ncbi:alpha-L-fucosidase [Rhodopirellula sallentina]|uniref:alpha-L-fucosidase n=1 Tax=Rhodopirellula sallentina SM41 TaxID=1263870 RepID=M5TUX9_9BACT|nr:alpha-L-fucosidase [Rhodopirellula sallentina]EMI52844.1 glycosyl hydrolase [Rhodopirellula sallentina SM41]
MYHKLITLCLLTLLTSGSVFAEGRSETETERDSRMAWWREAKFGMFVHWGIYSVVGGEYKGQKLPNSAEWMMNRGKVPIAEYEKYAAQFNPTKFDADEFVARAKNAGMKYLVITAKHHDGFSMFGSNASPYNVVDATPFGRDIMKELSEACQKQNIRLGFYYSQAQDWHHPGGMGNSWDKSLERVSNDEYVREKAAPEVRQLLTEYGPIGIFWWDTPRKMSEESFNSLHSLTQLRPDVITNDRLGDEFPGDYDTFERQIPRNAPQRQDWEVCMPISGSWGYKLGDDNFKSTSTLIRNLVDIASKGGNYLLNVSPTGEGTLLPQAIERLEQIGEWMSVNSESIYGTTASPIGSFEWGRCTLKSGKPDAEGQQNHLLYIHVFDWPSDGKLSIPGLVNTVHDAHLLANGDAVTATTTDEGVTLSLPGEAPDEIASVIALRISGPIETKARVPSPNKDGELVLTADDSYIHNNEGSRQADVRQHDGISHVGYWLDEQASVQWDIKINQPGKFKVSATMSVEGEQTTFRVGPAGGQLEATVPSTGSYGKYAERELGTIEFDEAGDTSILVKPVPGKWQPMNLREVKLQRVED